MSLPTTILVVLCLSLIVALTITIRLLLNSRRKYDQLDKQYKPTTNGTRV